MNMLESTIYIIDNDQSYTDRIKSILNTNGFNQVYAFNDATKALNYLSMSKEREPDLIITELYFNKVSGDDTIKKLKDQYENIKILVLSGTKRLSDSIRCIGKYKVNKFLQKGIEDGQDAILTTIRRELEKRSSTSDLIKLTFDTIERECLHMIQN